MFKKVGVLMGGISSEREISLKTGEAIYSALLKLGYNAVKIDVREDFIDKVSRLNIDVAFIALHGRYGEDGVIQGILEFAKIPYTGTGVMGSAIAMNKIATKRLVMALGINTPIFWINEDEVEFPVVVKPVSEGSTIGVSIANDRNELKKGIENARKYSNEIFFEKYINGKEVTVSVLCGKALPVIEIKPKKGFYDYESKYTKGATDYIIPAEIDSDLTKKLQMESEIIFKELKAKGAIRVDYIIKDNTSYLLEVNTIPGMTPTSLLPKAANYVGLTFEEVVERILKDV